MSVTSDQRSAEFLKVSGQFKLGALVTESSHPLTANVSEVAQRDVEKALNLLLEVDGDVVSKFREFVQSGRAEAIKEILVRSLGDGGKVFFTGCGSTGRLSIQLVSIWRDFWQRQRARGLACSPSTGAWENRAVSVMAGGDFALIKSVEGFEDFAAFGQKQIGDLGLSGKDVVFAITEGGETSFVIGTAWKGIEVGAKVYFVYNNRDDLLRANVERSRVVLDDPRIEKINLTTGPMAITGSTRMQATTIQLCVLLTVLEMVVRDVMAELAPGWGGPTRQPSECGPSAASPRRTALESDSVPEEFLAALTELHESLRSPAVLRQLAGLVALEECVYRAGRKNNYYADRLGIDVLTDTTERSPTYCTPPFRKFDDPTAGESWSFLFLPDAETPKAWERILKREPQCVAWNESEIRQLAGQDMAARAYEAVRKISCRELMRFKIGLDGLPYRRLREGDSAVGILCESERESLLSPAGFHRAQLEAANKAGARTGLVYFGDAGSLKDDGGGFVTGPRRGESSREPPEGLKARLSSTFAPPVSVLVPVPQTDFLLDGVTRVGVKMALNAVSTCTMVRLGRVLGNTMIWVVPGNLKLIDRATRYIQRLAGLPYEAANRLLFEVVEYVEPRMKADRAYPPVVGLAVMRARHKLTNEEAERRFLAQQFQVVS
jgi:N-acetylmuramic acid 6-phosphate etherase